METSARLHKIIWGVEAFSEDKKLQNKTAHLLTAINTKAHAEIEPVYVLSPDQLRLPVEVFTEHYEEPHYTFENFSDHSKEVATVIKSNLKIWLDGLAVPDLVSPRLLVQEEFSLRASVSALINYAHATNASWIAVSTHAREGIARFLLGSFAETLVYHSDLPVLIVGPDTSEMADLQHIIFPTDFTKKSREVFESSAILAKELGAEILLYHKISSLTDYVSTFYQDAHDLEFRMRNGEMRQRVAEDWIDWATRKGVNARFIIDEDSGEVPASILNLAKRIPSSMIVIASQTGPVASVILGSITRNIVRHASCPVLVVHGNS